MKAFTFILIFFFFIHSVKAQHPVMIIPTAHTGLINGLDISHNGKYIATCAVDYSMKLWDYRTKKELDVLKEYLGSVYAVRPSPDDSLLLSGSNDTVD
jgi:WD40 repeat protein